ncbi:hypothetical protein CLF_111924 [Clonorchis sinensis]|uniref:Uncharacterized protein n=1 Tax=Clonorchis sinensis TaxID=79923 RepID=G7YVJ5_CLOSI|nr:hypothetical protein CLF_111924 [Clonorchis sinensis]
MLTAFTAVSPTSPIQSNHDRILSISVVVTDARKSVPAGNEYYEVGKSLKRQVVKNLRKDRELRWTLKAHEMEKASATVKSMSFITDRSTGPRKATVETAQEEHEIIIITFNRKTVAKAATLSFTGKLGREHYDRGLVESLQPEHGRQQQNGEEGERKLLNDKKQPYQKSSEESFDARVSLCQHLAWAASIGKANRKIRRTSDNHPPEEQWQY